MVDELVFREKGKSVSAAAEKLAKAVAFAKQAIGSDFRQFAKFSWIADIMRVRRDWRKETALAAWRK